MALKGSVKLNVAGDLTEEEIEMDFDPVMHGTELFGPRFKIDSASAEPGLSAYTCYDGDKDLTITAFFDSSNTFVKFHSSRQVQVYENTLHV